MENYRDIHKSGMNIHNALKRIERLEKENLILKAKLKEKDDQIKYREDKFHEQKEKTNELYDENRTLKDKITELEQQLGYESEKEYIVYVSWDADDFQGEGIDAIFDGMCLKKAFIEESPYGHTQAYKYCGTPSARKILTRSLTAICSLNYPTANIHVYAKEIHTS